MSRPLRIFLVDDHPFVRQGVRACLEAAGHLVCGEASHPEAALQQLDGNPADLVITDIRMGSGSGTDLLLALQAHANAPPCIVLTMLSEPAFVQRMMSLGAHGYVLKDDPMPILLEAIASVSLRGQHFLSPALRSMGVDVFRSRPQLSPKEVAVLRLLADSHSSQHIADALGMSVRTVESHRLRLRRKLHLDGSGSLLRYAQDYAALEPCH